MQNLIQVDTLNQVNPFALPSLPIERISQLPEKSCIYFVYRKMAVLYIGKSTNLKSRWMAHQKHEFLQDIDSVCISWFECDSDQLDTAERFFIDQYLPRLNKQYVPSCLLTHDGIESSAEPFPYDSPLAVRKAFLEANDKLRHHFWVELKKARNAYMTFAIDVLTKLDDGDIGGLRSYAKRTLAFLIVADQFWGTCDGGDLIGLSDVPEKAKLEYDHFSMEDSPLDCYETVFLPDMFCLIEESICQWMKSQNQSSGSPE